MTWATTATGVVATAGRGRNKAIVFEVDFSTLDRWAQKMKFNMPRYTEQAHAVAAKTLSKKFAKVITRAGGVEGVPKFKDFEEFTKQLRAARGETNKPMGGVLADKSVVVFYKKNGWWIVGWPDRLAQWAVKFQDGGDARAESDFTDPKFRHWMHVKGIKDVPTAYVHNPRKVLPDPFGTYVDQHMDEWAKAILYTQLARRFQKAAATA